MTTTRRILLFMLPLALAQNCYFPNGNVAPDSSPCFPNGGGVSVCCPLNWQCESNGLCYLDAEDYYGRYSCTDESWSDSTCPQYCTQNGTAPGNEAILHCEDGHWCCDGNRSKDCCDDPDAEVIDVPDGRAVAFVSETPSPSSAASMSRTSTTTASSSISLSTSSSTSTTSASSSTSSSTQPPAAVPTTITSRSATTDSAGIATTVILVSTATLSSESPPTSSSSPPRSKIPLIAGLAAGIPAFLLLATAIAFLLYRRKRAASNPPTSDRPSDSSSNYVDMYLNTSPDGKPPMLDGYPVEPGTKPGHKHYSQISELSGSPVHQGHSPAVSSLHSPRLGFGGGLAQVEEEKELPPNGPVELPADSHNDNNSRALSVASYPGHVPYGGGQVHAQQQARASYVPYRPSVDGVEEMREVGRSPALSPMDEDRGQLGAGVLRIVNL